MKTQNKMNRVIATFFLLIFFPTLIPQNLYASNNGPKSPEAASFEPVDATDMVNLVTGQYSYVLPLLNVPSPEGGYPIAMGYHAGIAMDQEASWTGLGWNVNPGAIDRSVNGYPDDYNASELQEYFWDKTHTDSRYSASIGYSSGLFSVGLGFNWGSNQSLGGFVSTGVGVDLGGGNTLGVNVRGGTDGSTSVGIGYTCSGGLSVGLNAGNNGDIGLSSGFDNNGTGFSIGANTNGSTSFGFDIGTGSDNSMNLDFTFSSTGVGISGGVTNKTGKKIDGGVGGGMFLSFNNSMSMGDYSTSSSGWMIPLVVPTPIGIFSATFGKQEFKYWLGKNLRDVVKGPLYFNNKIYDIPIYRYTAPVYLAHNYSQICTYPPNGTAYCPYDNIALNGPHGYGVRHFVVVACDPYNTNDGFPGPHSTPGGQAYIAEMKRAFMDINEISLTNNLFSNETNVKGDNMTFPSYDNFNLSGQGISGSMTATHYKNGALFGLDGKENKEGYALKYAVRDVNASSNAITKFNTKPEFEFDNEISTYLSVNPANFNTNSSVSAVLDHYSNGVDNNDKPRRRLSNYIEYYTNNQILSDYANLKAKGYLQPEGTGFNRINMPKDGIGAFKVTTVDGKTYHYSLPVYNHEVITRTFGIISDSPNESESYFEKRQLEPFATHWLLTAVTGPDYVDNGDGIAGEGDLGYWTAFEYGKWSDAYVWKNPYKKDYIIDESNPNVKTWIRGRKQLYYLDKIKTRTHTALFIKGTRQDSPSPQWNYDAAQHLDNLENNSVSNRFVVPSQQQLRLEKIILVKNSDQNLNKNFGYDANTSVLIKYNQSGIKENEEAKYNCFDNIVDTNDDWQSIVPNALKVIDFNYDYSLVPGDNRLTLKSVDFKGKAGEKVLPPYKFEYINNSQSFNIDEKDSWGYNVNNPSCFSLKKITTPQGGIIDVNYQEHNIKVIVPFSIKFTNTDLNYTAIASGASATSIVPAPVTVSISTKKIQIPIGTKVKVSFRIEKAVNRVDGYIQYYNGEGTVTSTNNQGNYSVTLTNPIVTQPIASPTTTYYYNTCKIDLESKDNVNLLFTSGARISSIKVSDGTNNYLTDYKYGQNENGIGYVSYLPFSQNIAKEVPYSAELPAPRVMYEYVTMSSYKEGIVAQGKVRYRFNIMKDKDTNKVKYGDFYEIQKTTTPTFINSLNKEVSINSYTVKENYAALGQLLEVATLNPVGQVLNKVYSNYYDINSIPNNIGITQESYQSYKEVDYVDNSNVRDKWVINSSTRIKYPSIVKSSTEVKGGYTYTTEFGDWDLVSGISKEQTYTSSDGKKFKTKVVPAYLKYPQMGSKVDNSDNRNMLSQTAAEYSYIMDNGAWKETGVGITTWNNQWTYQDIDGSLTTPTVDKEKIWRKHKTYTWNGVKDNQGIFQNYISATDDGFDWTIGVGSQPAQWKQTSEVTKYDHYSMLLEAKDINGNHAATKMGDNETKITAVGNAKYNELFYSGMENVQAGSIWLEPGIKLAGGTRASGVAHTGSYAVKTTNTNLLTLDLKANQHKATKYKLNVWVHKNNVTNAGVNYGGSTYAFNGETKQAGDWVLKTHYLNVPITAMQVNLTSVDGTEVIYDDVMLRPIASGVTGYVYNRWDELSEIVANNGLATRFEYDAAGRVIKTYVEVFDDASNQIVGGFKLSSQNKINYKYSN